MGDERTYFQDLTETCSDRPGHSVLDGVYNKRHLGHSDFDSFADAKDLVSSSTPIRLPPHGVSVPSTIHGILKVTATKCCKGAQIDSTTVDTIIDILVSKFASKIAQGEDANDEFSCPYCHDLLYEPITLNCGHSICKVCAQKASQCRKCKSKIDDASSRCVNLLLSSILQKWHSMEYVSRSMTEEGNSLLKQGRTEEAVCKYMDAMECAPNSHLASCYRAQAFASLGNYECAYKDATNVIELAELWPEGYLIKGEVEAAMGKEDEALSSFLSCLSLDPTNTHAGANLKMIISKVMSADSEPVLTRKRKLSGGCDSTPNKCSTLVDWSGIEATTQSSYNDSPKVNMASEDVLDAILAEIDSHMSFGCSTQVRVPTKRSFHRTADQSLIDSSDFECSLCMRTFLQPVCTPCGHTFCMECLERCLDHSMPCPLCKKAVDLNIVNKNLHRPIVDAATDSIIKRFLPEEHTHRLDRHEEEIKHLKESIPIFVCTIAFPSVPCPLHIYEPRYRLMLRRVMAIHGKQFGICRPKADNTFSEIGTLLQVQKVTFLPDGRSVVESVGSKRFEILDYCSSDGYDTAKVQYLVDQPVEKDQELIVLRKLLDMVYIKASNWFETVDSQQKEKIRSHFGELPQNNGVQGEDGPNWTWWMLAVLPVDDNMKMNILRKRLLRERLLLLHRILTYLKKKTVAPANEATAL